MNEARVYADGFERSFAEVKDLLEFLAERGRNAKWIRKPTNTLRLAPLEKEAQNLDAADASMEEILEDTEKNTQLVLKMRGESYPVRDCAIRTILSRAGVNGDGLRKLYSGLKLNFQLSGVTRIELESVDGYALSGTVGIQWDETGQPVIGEAENAGSILVFNAPDENGFTPGKDYSIFTLPCDLYGGYRLSIYKDGLVAHYFGVHQTVEPGTFITPGDLAESELEFDDPDAPLVEEERPELDATTTALLRQYQQNQTEENKQALLNQMGIR